MLVTRPSAVIMYFSSRIAESTTSRQLEIFASWLAMGVPVSSGNMLMINEALADPATSLFAYSSRSSRKVIEFE